MSVQTNSCNSSPVSSNIHIFGTSRPEIGYIARTTTQGQEFEMVATFIECLVSKYSKNKSKKAAIFIEPQIDTGYPDIVIIEYSSLPSLPWKKSRSNLSPNDLKLLYYIQKNHGSKIDDIIDMLGFPADTVEKSLMRLRDSGLIYLSKKYARNTRLRSYCRVNKVIAIEAKIDKWKEAIRQANNNIWFATESYVLLNKEECSPNTLNLCKEYGLGIILVNKKIHTQLAAQKRTFPVSYASLQFNEWLLRAMNTQEE